MPWRLHGLGHDHELTLPDDRAIVVGRAAASDMIVPDVTVSRRHAELRATPAGVRVRDLESSNGTAINGARITEGFLTPNDTVTFGKVSYRLTGGEAAATDPGTAATVVRAVPVGGSPTHATPTEQAERLARLLDLAKRLSGELELDGLIGAVVEGTFALLPVDRVSLLLLDEKSDELVPALSRSRVSDAAAVRVPRSIARRTVLDRAPIITENAAADERLRSGSVMLQSVRGAISTPLLASEDRVLGVLYADSLTLPRGFTEDEATLLFAFAGIAAVALGKARDAEAMRRAERVRANFERFFAPNVAERIARQTDQVALGGERRLATVLFADIRGFTQLSERLRPEEVAALLTDYFTEMVDLVFELGGTLDKFIGDALMAVWGAPLTADDDADRALEAGLLMQRRVVELNARWTGTRPPIAIGVGIATGEVFAGYLGSERRLEYSVLGDTVNVASRLSDLAAPGQVLVSEALVARLRAPPALERMPDVALRGKAQQIGVFRVA